ncbi:hypothetical protein P7K49_036175, partial [Saguinus oedipus]
ERQEEEAGPGDPPPGEEVEEAERFLAHSLPARLLGRSLACSDPQAAVDPGEELRAPASALRPRLGL